ncbi:hypothetical protein [Escherichia phage IMM-001]|nr:hypothetical protein [Escherichia phage IMM-001]
MTSPSVTFCISMPRCCVLRFSDYHSARDLRVGQCIF